jgi:AhpD family alkylhydroperoxidase
MRALGGVHVSVSNCGLPKELVDLVDLRLSQIYGCAYCIGNHRRDLLTTRVSAGKRMLVSAWHERGDLFSEQERGPRVD